MENGTFLVLHDGDEMGWFESRSEALNFIVEHKRKWLQYNELAGIEDPFPAESYELYEKQEIGEI